MESLSFSEKVTLEDLDSNLNLSNRGILKLLQEAGNKASTLAGHGLTDMDKTNTTWVILYWRVKVLNRAKYDDELKVNTWAYFKKKLYSIRNFEIYNGDELVAIADSKWVYVDAKNHSILKIPNEFDELYSTIEKDVFDVEYKDKIKMPDNLKEIYTYNTMKRDVDGNNHVNNIAFLDIANEVIDDEIILNSTEFSVIYKKEIHYGDTVTCYKEIDEENNTIVYLYNKDKGILNGVIKIK